MGLVCVLHVPLLCAMSGEEKKMGEMGEMGTMTMGK